MFLALPYGLFKFDRLLARANCHFWGDRDIRLQAEDVLFATHLRERFSNTPSARQGCNNNPLIALLTDFLGPRNARPTN